MSLQRIFKQLTAFTLVLAAGASAEAEIITTIPETAVDQQYNFQGSTFTTFWGATFPVTEAMLPSRMAFDGNDVYWFSPLVSESFNAYIKGVLADGKISFEFPQQVASYGYLNRLVRTSEEGDPYAYAIEDGVPNVLSFSVAEDGTLTMDEGDEAGSVILGYTNKDGKWANNGIFDVTLTEFNKELVEAPAGLETFEWVMSYTGVTREVAAGFDGNDFYVKGLSERCPKAWAKGTVKGDEVIFPSDVYVGLDPELGYRVLMYGAETEYVYSPSWGSYVSSYVLLPEFKMKYNAETEVMTAESELLFCPGERYKNMVAFAGYEEVTLRPKTESNSLTPAAPVIRDVIVYPQYPNEGWDYIAVTLSIVNTEGQPLNPDNIYYRVLLDGEPYIIDPNDYVGIKEPMEWIPFDFSSYDLEKTSQCGRDVSIFISGVDVYSIQEKYVDGDTEYFSEIASMCLSEIDVAVAPDVEEQYYTDMLGRRVANPVSGIYLLHEVFSNGKTRVTKTAVK